MRRIYTKEEAFGGGEPEIIEKGKTMLVEPETGWRERMKGIGEIPTFKTPKPLSLENLTLVSLPQETELDILNDKIEGTYTEYLKLQKKIEEFDTSLSEIPNAMKPTIVANYNKAVNEFNSLIGELQTDIAKRDQIISIQEETQKKQDFIKQKRLAEAETEPQYTTLAASGTGWQQRMAGMGELPGRVKVPISKSDESDLKDIMDAFILTGSGILQQTKDYFKNALQHQIFAPIETNQLYGVNITDEQKKKINIENKKKLELADEGYLRSLANYSKWLEDNPQLQPRKEWEKGVFETIKNNPEVLLDPAYWAYVASNTAAFTFTAMGTTLGVTTLTGNPLIGAAAGVMAAIPFQTQDLYEDFIRNGGTDEQAKYLVPFMGAAIACVEVMGDLPILASVSKPFRDLLYKNIKNTVVLKVAAWAMKSKLTKFATFEISETLEEVVQAALQDACVMTVNENRKFLGDLKEIVTATPIATVPFSMFGVSADIKAQAKIQSQIKAKISKLVNDRNLRDAIRIQLEEQGIIPREPQPVTLAAKTEEEIKAETKKKVKPKIKPMGESFKEMLEERTEIAEAIKEQQPEEIPVFEGTYKKVMVGDDLFYTRDNKNFLTENEVAGLATPEFVKEILKAEPKKLTPEELRIKREALRKRGGIPEDLLANDEWVKKAKRTVIPKIEIIGGETISDRLEDLEKITGFKETKEMTKEINFDETPEVNKAIAKADEIIENSKLNIEPTPDKIDIAIKELKDSMTDKTMKELSNDQKERLGDELLELQGIKELIIETKPTKPSKVEIPKAKELEEKEKPTIRGINYEENPEVYNALAKADDIIEKSKLKIKYPLGEIDTAIKELKDAMLDETLNTKDKRQISREFIELKNVQKQIKMKPTEYTEIEIPKAKMLPEEKKKMIPELEPLAEEARKYKSVEEFMEAQGQPLYHGTKFDAKFERFIEGYGKGFKERGIFFTDNIDVARAFTGDKEFENIKEAYLDIKNPLIIDAKGAHWTKIEFEGKNIDIDSFAGIARKRGNDGVIVKNVSDVFTLTGNTYIALKPDQIKTKQQLTDIYNQATAGVKAKEEITKKVIEPPKPPVPPKEVTLAQPEPEPEFNKDIKVGDVYTIGEKTPTKKVKGKIREVTGQTKKDKILISELDILDLVLKGQEKAAKKAFSEGKKEGIFAQKEHFEEVVARAKERKAQKEYINKLIKDINKLPTENVAIDYKDKIEAIKDMFDLKKRQQKTLHAREETVKFIEREMEKGDTVLNIPQKVLDIIKTIPLNDMTIAQLETVHDSIIHLAKIGKLKGKMIKVQKGKEIKELARDLVATLYENKVNKISQEKYGLDFNELNRTQKQDIIEDFQKKTRNIKQEIKDISSLKQKVKDPWNHYWINTTLDESLFEKMDGEERGLWHEIFYNTINNCTNTELLNTFEKIEKIRNLFNDNKIDIDKFLQERTGDLMLTHSQRAGLYLCSLDEDALRHIQNAGVIIKKGLEPYQFTDKDIKDVSDSLTKEEKAVVKFYQEYQLTQEKELDEFDVRVRGVHLKGVKNRFAIQVLGEDLYNSVSVELEHNPLTRRAYMEEGFRKERTHRAENVIMLDCITNMLRDIAKVEHYKAYKEAEMDINNLLSNPELKKAILGNPKYGRVAYENITQWFKDSVKAKQNKILSTSDKTLMFLRTSAFISMLGFNILSGTKQLISLSNAVGLVGLPAVLSGIEQVSLHYNETKQFVFKVDPQARARKGIIDRVMQEWMETTEAKQILKNQTGDIRMKTLFLIRMLDEYAVLSVWKGTYDSVINTQKIGGKKIKFTDAADLERQAIEYAAYAIRKTQPSALMKDLPQWFRDGTVAKMFSLFQNQINKNQNFLRDTFRQYKAGKISTGTLAWRTLWNLFLPAILIGTITRGRPPEDWKEYARDIATYYAGGWFFVGSIVVNMMQGYGGWMPAPLSFGEEFVKAYTYKTWESRFKHAISGACKVIGLPYNQPYRTIEGVDDWIQGETEDIRRLIWTEYVLGKEEEKPSFEKTKKKKIKKTKKTKKKKKI